MHPPRRPQKEVCSSIFLKMSLIRKTQEDSMRNRKKGNLIYSRSVILALAVSAVTRQLAVEW